MTWTPVQTPMGTLTVIAAAGGIRRVCFPEQPPALQALERAAMPELEGQLGEYFAGLRRSFELELELLGNELQLAVWGRLREIPFGETISYGELSREIPEELYPERLESYRRARLVGAIVGQTPTPILVPCHRVIGADGSLTGYGGGLPRKRALLELEGATAVRPAAELQLSLL